MGWESLWELLFPLVPIVFITFFLVSLLRDMVEKRRFMATARPAQGIVIDLIITTDSESSTEYPVVRFISHDGRTFDAKSRNQSYGLRIGQTVELFYDPLNPHYIRVKSSPPRWIFFLLGAFSFCYLFPLFVAFLIDILFTLMAALLQQ